MRQRWESGYETFDTPRRIDVHSVRHTAMGLTQLGGRRASSRAGRAGADRGNAIPIRSIGAGPNTTGPHAGRDDDELPNDAERPGRPGRRLPDDDARPNARHGPWPNE